MQVDTQDSLRELRAAVSVSVPRLQPSLHKVPSNKL